MANINEMLDDALKLQNELAKAREVRMCLTTFIDQDRGFYTEVFDDKIQYCLDHGITERELYQEPDGVNFDGIQATEDNYKAQKLKLRDNFSKKRLEFLECIGKTVYPKHTQEDSKRKLESPHSSPGRTNRSETSGAKWIPYAAVGLIVGAGLGALIGGKIVVGAIVGTGVGLGAFVVKKIMK